MTTRTIGLGLIVALMLAGTSHARRRGGYTPSWASEIGGTVIADVVELQQTALGDLDALMSKPCSSADCRDMQRAWWGVIDTLMEGMRDARRQAKAAYVAKNKGKATLKNEHATWFNDHQSAWNWLRNDGGKTFLWIKQVQLMTANNVAINIPGAAYALKWFVEQTKTIDDTVGIIRGVRDKNLAKRYVSQYKPHRDLAKLISEVHKTWSRDEKKFLERTDPKQYSNYKVYVGDWPIPEDSMFVPYKEAWSKNVEKAYKDYKKSYKALFVVADPVIEGDFMNDNGRIKRWEPGKIGKEFGDLFAELERRAR